MAVEITSEDYESVRKLIDVNLTTALLPDSVIELDVYTEEAVEFVTSRTDNDNPTTHRAAVYKLASLLAPALPDIFKESNAGYSYEKVKADYLAKAEELESKALDLIARAEETTPTRDEEPMPGFTVGSRSRCGYGVNDILDA